jgi:hypothetical protein
LIEAIDFQLRAYQERLKIIEDLDEDEASDLGNDLKFLESLRHTLANNKNESQKSFNILNKEQLAQQIIQLSVKDKLLLVDIITESIRQELSPI